ncbi:MAG: aminoglycoside phosphotransferase family protein [Actinomycetota bacterium]|nr:aminoglycoside phosphotransferase family protein [Actinomycetota bacterium]
MGESLEALLARASSRTVLRSGDARSGSEFERVEIDGDRYFLKRLSPASDWIMRVTGDHVHRPYLVWQAGIMDEAPDCIDHTVVAMEVTGEGDGAVLSMLMRDVGPFLVPEGDNVVPDAQHRGFTEHLAALSAAFWGWQDTIGGLMTIAQRLRFFAPDNIAAELLVDEVPGPIAAADAGWRALPERSPLLWSMARAVHDDPALVAEPVAATPPTFLHGDWKMGNLGTHPDGRTILLDWAYPGSGPACWDLCWYLALNRVRLPEPKEAAIERFRAALESAGVSTGSWWEAQLDLCVIGIMATFGWEKALGDDGELRWWEDQAGAALRRQRLALPGVAL